MSTSSRFRVTVLVGVAVVGICAAALPKLLTTSTVGSTTHVTNAANMSGLPWSNPSYAESIDQTNFASVITYVPLSGGGSPVDHTSYLKCQDFVFDGNVLNGPNDQITGIRLTAYGQEGLGAAIPPLTPSPAWHFKMVDYDGIQTGLTNGDTTTLFSSYSTYTSRSYPASATNYLWNSSSNQPTWYLNDSNPNSYPTDAEIVNDADFGAVIWLNYYGLTSTVEIDGVEMEIYYNEGGDPNKPRITRGRSSKLRRS